MGWVEADGVAGAVYVPRQGGGLRYYRSPVSGRLATLLWAEDGLRVRTRYAGGKPYQFTITKSGAVEWIKW